jgi:hypothetical protein
VGAHLRSHEDGITAAIFAVALIALLGMVAVGIDGSRIYDERRQAQNAVDHAAIAAALASCTIDPADAEQAGLDSAELNGYDDVPATEVAITASATAHEYEAEINAEIATTFAQVIGFGELNTTVTATAKATGCEPVGSGVPALFGGGDCAFEKDIDISGEFHVVKGLVHTNGDFYNGGSKSQFTNPGAPSVTYVDDFEGKESDQNIYVKDEEQVAVQPWPPGYDPAVNMNNAMWDAYKAARVNNLATPNPTPTNFNIILPGIYYTETTSEVTIGTIAPNVSFTIVSKNGPVRFGNTHNGEWAAFPNNPPNTPEDIIVVSGYGSTFSPTSSDHCAKMAFLRSGEGGTWRGIFWAPHAGIEWSGNLGTVHGGLLGYSIKLNGNYHNIHGGSGMAAAVPDVFLTE